LLFQNGKAIMFGWRLALHIWFLKSPNYGRQSENLNLTECQKSCC